MSYRTCLPKVHTWDNNFICSCQSEHSTSSNTARSHWRGSTVLCCTYSANFNISYLRLRQLSLKVNILWHITITD